VPIEFIKTALITLLVTLDPPGLAPMFIGLTRGMSATAKREVAARATAIAFLILAAFSLCGRAVLDALGVSFQAFRISGGLLLFALAFDMLFALRGERKRELASDAVTVDHIRNVAGFPLAIPLMAGPGAITATTLLAGRAGGDWGELGALMAVVALAMAITFVTLLMSERVSRLLGVTGNVVLTRMFGPVLAAMAVQFVIDGVGAIGK
jgi:multiple antibiotic resistance protein